MQLRLREGQRIRTQTPGIGLTVMEPRSIIVGKNRRTGKLEILGDMNEPVAQTESRFMPFRLKREDAEYEWTALCSLNVERLERFSIPATAPVSEQLTKKGKSK